MWLDQEKKRAYFTELYDLDFDYVYSYVFNRTAGDAQLTEDIVQESFTAAWFSLHRFEQKSTFRTWLCSIAKNKLKTYYRKTIYRDQHESVEDGDVAEHADGFDLEKAVIDHEIQREVFAALNAINPIYRYALIMKYMDGMRVKEIASVLGRSPKAVDGILQRAKISFEKTYIQTKGHKQADGR